MEYNPVTKYVYENELERKEARFFESIVADVEAEDRHEMEADYKAAENAWKRQTRQAMIDTEDRAAITAYKDAGVDEVMWITQRDEHVCEECIARNGLIFPIDRVPEKPHYGCRCYLVPVKGLKKQPEDDTIGMERKKGNIGVFSTLPERMSKKHVRQVAKDVGIDLTGITLNIDADVEKLNESFGIFGRADGLSVGRIDLFPLAFKSKEDLVRTLYHETLHVQQYKEFGVTYVQNNQRYFEKITYEKEDEFIKRLKEEGRL